MRGYMLTFLLGAAVGAGGMYMSRTYHIVHAGDGMHVVPKLTTQFGGAYVDVRDFDASQWNQHRPLAVALVRANKGHVLGSGAGEGLRNAAQGVLNALGEGTAQHELK